MIAGLNFGGHKDSSLHLAMGTSLALHLALAALLGSLPPGTLSGSRVSSWQGGQGFRAILLTAPSSAAAAAPAQPADLADQPRATSQSRSPSTAEAGQPGQAKAPRTGLGPGPDTYTTVETRTIVHAPVSSYYTLGELDIRPWIAAQVEPEYPEAAARRFMSGKVVIRVLINEQGRVDRTVIISSDPQGFFEIPAQNAFNAARYTPAVKMGKAVKSQLTIEVTFNSAAPPKIVEQQAQR